MNLVFAGYILYKVLNGLKTQNNETFDRNKEGVY